MARSTGAGFVGLSVAALMTLFVGTIGTTTGTTGCTGSASTGSGGTPFTCNGQPASFPLDDLTSTNRPDEFTNQAAATLASSLSAGQIQYLNEIDWSKFTGANVFTDPVVRAAVESLQPLVSQYCTTLTLRECGFSIGVAHAQSADRAVFDEAGRIITQGAALAFVWTIVALCGATVCTVAGIVAALAIIYDSSIANADQLPDVGAPVDPRLYNITMGASSSSGGSSGSGSSGGSSGGGSGVCDGTYSVTCSAATVCGSCPNAAEINASLTTPFTITVQAEMAVDSQGTALQLDTSTCTATFPASPPDLCGGFPAWSIPLKGSATNQGWDCSSSSCDCNGTVPCTIAMQ